MMRLRPSRRHFPYARYTHTATPCTCWRCRVRRALRRVLQSHDFWCWLYAAIVLATLIALEVIRAYR